MTKEEAAVAAERARQTTLAVAGGVTLAGLAALAFWLVNSVNQQGKQAALKARQQTALEDAAPPDSAYWPGLPEEPR